MKSDVKFGVLRGAAVLTLGALVVKAIGALFKIPLTNLLGGEGMSYYMSAFELFGPVYALTAAGVPTLVCRDVSANPSKMKQTLASYLSLCRKIGLVSSVLLAISSPFLCALVGNKGAVLPTLALCPAVYFGCVVGCYRGFFQGLHNMVPTASSQLLEALFKLCAGILLCVGVLRLLGPNALPMAAAGALFGVSASGGVCALYLRRKVKFALGAKPKPLGGGILKSAVPICLCAFLSGFAALVDLFTITRLAGENSTFLYGAYAGIGLTLVNILPALSATVGVSALPSISAGYARGQYVGGAVSALYRYSAVFAIPCGAGLFTIAPQVLALLYGSKSAEIAAVCAPLRILCIHGVMWSVVLPLFSVLQGAGKPSLPLFFCLVGGGIKLALNLYLLPQYALVGAALATVCASGAVLICSMVAVGVTTGGFLKLKTLFSVLFGTGLCCAMAHYSFLPLCYFVGSKLATLGCAALGGGVYLIYVLSFGLIDKKDLS